MYAHVYMVVCVCEHRCVHGVVVFYSVDEAESLVHAVCQASWPTGFWGFFPAFPFNLVDVCWVADS